MGRMDVGAITMVAGMALLIATVAIATAWLVGSALLFVVEVILHQPPHEWWIVLLVGLAVMLIAWLFRGNN